MSLIQHSSAFQREKEKLNKDLRESFCPNCRYEQVNISSDLLENNDFYCLGKNGTFIVKKIYPISKKITKKKVKINHTVFYYLGIKVGKFYSRDFSVPMLFAE